MNISCHRLKKKEKEQKKKNKDEEWRRLIEEIDSLGDAAKKKK